MRAAAGGDGQRHGAHARAELGGETWACVAVDERDELERGVVALHGGHELAGVGLPAAGLARHEVEQVEPYAHRCSKGLGAR